MRSVCTRRTSAGSYFAN